MKNGHKNRAYPLVDGWTYKTIIMHDCSCILTPICFENSMNSWQKLNYY